MATPNKFPALLSESVARGGFCSAGSYRFAVNANAEQKSFFIAANGDANQCDDLNAFMKSHVIVRTVENLVSSGQNCGIQILVEYKNVGEQGSKQNKRIDWRASLVSEEQKSLFDKLKAFRANLAKEKKLVGAYMVCKDEHLAAIVQNPAITAQEIQSLPHANNIMLKDFAGDLLAEYQKILAEQQKTDSQNEAGEIPF